MRILKKLFAMCIVLGLFQVAYSRELTIESIMVEDPNTIVVSLSADPTLSLGDVSQSEIILFQDSPIINSQISYGDSSQVEISLEGVLLPDTYYSLITVSGSGETLDFTTPSIVE